MNADLSRAERRQARLNSIIYIRQVFAEIAFIVGILMVLVGLACFLIILIGKV